jgi:hypothetical protein
VSKTVGKQAKIRFVSMNDAGMQMDMYFVCNFPHGKKTHFSNSHHLDHEDYKTYESYGTEINHFKNVEEEE